MIDCVGVYLSDGINPQLCRDFPCFNSWATCDPKQKCVCCMNPVLSKLQKTSSGNINPLLQVQNSYMLNMVVFNATDENNI